MSKKVGSIVYIIKHGILKYFERVDCAKDIANKANRFKQNIMENNISNLTFYHPVLINITILNDVLGIVTHLLALEPHIIQEICRELMKEVLDEILQPEVNISLEQIVCPIVVDSPVLMLTEHPTTGLCSLKGTLLEYSLQKSFIRHSSWICNTNGCKTLGYPAVIVNGYPAITPLCSGCACILEEVCSNRDMGNYHEGKVVSFDALSGLSPTNTTKAIQFRIEDDRHCNTTFVLGLEYEFTGVMNIKQNVFEVWGCSRYEKISRMLPEYHKIEQLRRRLQDNPVAFADVLSNCIASKLYPSGCFKHLRTGLLLSLASVCSQKPLPILAICEDIDAGLKIMLAATYLAKKCVTCYPFTEMTASFNESDKKYSSGALNMAYGGICFLGLWDNSIGKKSIPIVNAVECGKTPIYGSDGEYSPSKCAVWAVLEKPLKRKQHLQLKTLTQIFGLAWKVEHSPNEDTFITDFMLNSDRRTAFQVSEKELSDYISFVIHDNIVLTDEATDLIQKYFISSRHVRGGDLPMTSLELLTSLAEAHARINQKPIANVVDALIAIQLCELAMNPQLALPPPPLALVDFKNWLFENVLREPSGTDPMIIT